MRCLFRLAPLSARSRRQIEQAVWATGLIISIWNRQISQIIEKAGSTPGPAIGALTAENRDIWADARNSLLAASPSGLNAESLRKIESAVIIVALDDSKPITREDISSKVWAGNAKNRFYDKHQLIVFDNGRSGFLGGCFFFQSLISSRRCLGTSSTDGDSAIIKL